VVMRVTKVEMTFFSSEGWESGCLGRVVDGGGADLMLQFWLEMGDDGTKHCRKMKRRRRRGGTGEGKGRRRC
jgi:hypothetical protein